MTSKSSKKRGRDPQAKREAENYDNPIASREYILTVLDNAVGPLTREQLADILGIDAAEQEEALRRRLNAMERDGQIYRNRKQAFARVDKLDLIRGRVQGHRDGYGFLTPTEGGEDIYLAYRQMRKVFDGDEVLVRLAAGSFRGKREGNIVEVVTRNTQQIVGRYHNESGVSFVRPENPRITHDIMVPQEDRVVVSDDQFVMVEIIQYPSRQTPALGRIVEVLGDHMAPGMEIDVAIRSHNLPHEWPQAVQDEASGLPVVVDEADKRHRVDLRDCHFVTIDGEDARDFDDAVYCEPRKAGSNKSGWRLLVAIADVSHYVQVASALDQEAEQRSTSVYFPDFVLPMLPEALSNGLCSLNPEVDRLAMVCEMTISASGRISSYQFYEGLIHSHARLTYTKVGKMIASKFAEEGQTEEGQKLREKYAPVAEDIDNLYQLYKVLRGLREQRGAIDFDTTETRILFDEQRKISRIVPVVRNDAHKLIEECMLCANVCAARFLEKHELDGLYRVHQGPKEQKLENLRAFLSELGLGLSGKNQPSPGDYQKLVDAINERPDAKVIQTVMLRSLSQAMYQPDNEGHFGLAYPAYTHFTSPIRRYPDLLTHRAIRHIIRSRKDSKYVQRVKGAKAIAKKTIYPYDMQDMVRLGEHTSMAERRADDATRDVVSWLKCEYLQSHLGDTFPGVITAVTNFGVFVELLDVYVEGLIHITALPSDYYHYEEAHHRLVGERTRRKFCLGDELLVQVIEVNLDERKVDFELVDQGAKKGTGSKNGSKETVREKLRRGDFSGLGVSKSQKKSPTKKSSAKKTSGKKKVSSKSKTGSKPKSKVKSNNKSKQTVKKKAPTTKKSTSKRVVRKRKIK